MPTKRKQLNMALTEEHERVLAEIQQEASQDGLQVMRALLDALTVHWDTYKVWTTPFKLVSTRADELGRFSEDSAPYATAAQVEKETGVRGRRGRRSAGQG